MTWVLLKRSIAALKNGTQLCKTIMIVVIFFNLQIKDASIFKDEVAVEDVETTNKMGEMVGAGDDGEEIV